MVDMKETWIHCDVLFQKPNIERVRERRKRIVDSCQGRSHSKLKLLTKQRKLGKWEWVTTSNNNSKYFLRVLMFVTVILSTSEQSVLRGTFEENKANSCYHLSLRECVMSDAIGSSDL